MINKKIGISVTLLMMTVILNLGNKETIAASYIDNDFQLIDNYNAIKISKNINTDKLYLKQIYSPYQTQYKPVGRIINTDYSNNMFYSGTGFVIGNYTYITNRHLVENINGFKINPSYLNFEIGRDGNKYKKIIKAYKIYNVPNTDLAIVQTKTKLSNYVKPMKLASESMVKNLKPKNNLYIVGYPMINNSNNKMYKTNNYFVTYSSSKQYMYLLGKSNIQGFSGSPITTYKNQVIGIQSSHSSIGLDNKRYTYINGITFSGKVRYYINKYNK